MGYLDYNETTKQAAIRETYEETGVRLSHAKYWSFNDNPEKDDLQNVTFRYYSIITQKYFNIFYMIFRAVKKINIPENSVISKGILIL